MTDKAARLNAMTGGNTSQPRKPKSDKVVHYKRNEPSEMTPTEFLEAAPKKFKADVVIPEGVWTITYTLYHKTDSCLTYVAQLKDLRETYLAPIYIFKRECGYQKRLMKLIYQRKNQPAWQVISGAHFHHELGDIVFKNELDPFLAPLKMYFGFELYQPIP
jgi:hypothetical protein